MLLNLFQSYNGRRYMYSEAGNKISRFCMASFRWLSETTYKLSKIKVVFATVDVAMAIQYMATQGAWEGRGLLCEIVST